MRTLGILLLLAVSASGAWIIRSPGGGGGGATVDGHAKWGSNQIAYYTFDDRSGTAIYDDTANNHDATAASSTDNVTGVQGDGWEGVVILDGNSYNFDYNYVVVNYWLQDTAWAGAAEPNILIGTSSVIYLWMGQFNNNLRMGFNNVGIGATFWEETPPSVDNWHMITFIWDDLGGAEMFINGVSQGTNAQANLDLAQHTGASVSDTYKTISQNSKMDEIGFWGFATAPSQTDIDDLYNSGSGIPKS